MSENEIITVVPTIWSPNVDQALHAWNAYQTLCKKLLNDDDYARIEGKMYRKRSGMRKLARAFNVTVEILDEHWDSFDGGFGYSVTCRASFPDGTFQDGDGYCDSTEFLRGRLKATRHNVRSKAITRAKNRAIADLIGTGEVTADEMTDDVVTESAPKESNGNGNGHSSGAGAVAGTPPQAVVDAGLCENVHSARAAIKHSKVVNFSKPPAEVLPWFKQYRGFRDSGLETPDAAAKADAAIV